MFVVKCLVISSDEKLVKEIELNIKNLPFINHFAIKSCFLSGISFAQEYNPSIIIADLNSFSELENTYMRESVMPSVPFIAISDDPMDAVKCYNSGIASDFLLKPFAKEQFIKSLSRALTTPISRINFKSPDSIFLKIGRSLKRVNINEIIFIEEYGIYTKVYTDAGRLIVNESISKMEQKLQIHNFIRVHKSFIINALKIDSISATHFEISEKKIPIGISYKSKLEGLLRFLSKEMELTE